MSTHVFFFGGWKSNLVDMKAWKADAIKQKPSVAFDCFPYPDGVSSDGEKGVKAFDISGAIKMVRASTADTIFIVGHSSGCAIANEVDDDLPDHKKINLVALDGFAPRNAQLERSTTQVWSAESGAHGKSLNHDRMLDRIEEYNKTAKFKQKVNMFPAAADCTTRYALHFSLVNLSANDKTVTLITDGYTKCKANLPWLP
jgi:hypothetical protein